MYIYYIYICMSTYLYLYLYSISSSVVHIKSTVNIQIIRGLLQYYSIVQNKLKNFYLTMNKQSKIFYINY